MSGKRAKRVRAAAGAVLTGERRVEVPGTAKQLRRAVRLLAQELAPPDFQARVNPQPVAVHPGTNEPVPRDELVRLLERQERVRSRWPRARR